MKIKNYISKGLLAVVLATSACTADFEKINSDPAIINKSVVKSESLFTLAQRRFTYQIPSQAYAIACFSGYYYNPASGNIFLEGEWSGLYNNFYRQYIINTAEVIRLTENDPNRRNLHAYARIMKAMMFGILTDCYGDVPYFEAAQSVENVILNPKYDTQEAIYKDLLNELKEAYEQITDTTQATIGKVDIIYGGNVAKWRRLANSLRLRLAMRVRYADEQLARTHITEALTRPLITSNSDNALVITKDDGVVDNQNPLYDKQTTQPLNHKASFTTTDILLQLNDPRLSKYVSNDPLNNYRGTPLQYVDEGSNGRYSNDSTVLLNPNFLGKVLNVVVMNAAEVAFLRAEAALAGISSEDANTLYRDGIRLAMSQYTVSTSDINTYLASAVGTLAGSDEQKLEQIIVQKWLGNYYNHFESWSEFRRTGYPRIWTGLRLGDTNGQIPRRVMYPANERLANAQKIQEAVERLEHGDSYMSRVWWDKKSGLPKLHALQGLPYPIYP
jgi:hypothetical protein